MHEMGVVINMLHSLEKIAQRNHLTAISRVDIELGEMTGVVPAYLKNFWPVAAEGTVCDRAELVIHPVKGIAHCLECGSEYPLMENVINEVPTCPACKSTRWNIKQGDQLVILEIAVPE